MVLSFVVGVFALGICLALGFSCIGTFLFHCTTIDFNGVLLRLTLFLLLFCFWPLGFCRWAFGVGLLALGFWRWAFGVWLLALVFCVWAGGVCLLVALGSCLRLFVFCVGLQPGVCFCWAVGWVCFGFWFVTFGYISQEQHMHIS